MVPKHSERRHRLNPVEIDPVKVACYYRLIQLLVDRKPEDIQEASALFRVWYRINTYCRNKPSYPNHGTWEEISSYLSYDTVSREEEKLQDLNAGDHDSKGDHVQFFSAARVHHEDTEK